MGKSWQHAFVASFPDTPLDESPYARRVTEHLGIDATFIRVDPAAALPDLERYLWLFEELYITSPVPFMLTYGQVRRHGISVTLDGHGADEVFGGYSFDFMMALADAGLNPFWVADIVSTLYDSYPQGSLQFPALPPKWRYLLRAYASNAATKILRRTPRQTSRDSAHLAWDRLDYLTRQLYVSAHETVLPTLLRNYDRYSMASGVEIRMPFLDWRLVTFAFALPWSVKIRNGYSKAIVRDAVAPFMPREIAYRKAKIGFNSPVVDWMKGPMRAFLLDTLEDQRFRECDLIDPPRVVRAVRHVVDSPAATFADGERAWTLLTPYLWQQAFLEGKGSAR
jgi:asparagine synthase (glutamine-hydrolysing)